MIENYLVDANGKSLLSEDCGAAAEEIEKNNIVPAFVVEILDRVKSHRIYSGKQQIDCDDIITSIHSYKKQMEIATVKDTKPSDAETLYSILKNVVAPEEEVARIKQMLNEVLEKRGF
jgi:hypothetical protein